MLFGLVYRSPGWNGSENHLAVLDVMYEIPPRYNYQIIGGHASRKWGGGGKGVECQGEVLWTLLAIHDRQIYVK
jgi:hypothetical protein